MSLYNDLGVSPDASHDDIKKAYRRAIAKAHPDRNGGDTEASKKLNDAYATLGDPERRKRYDETGDTDTAEDLNAVANANIIVILCNIAESKDEHNCVAVNILDQARESINHALRQEAPQKTQCQRKIRTLTKIASRLRKKSGTNFVLTALEQRIDTYKKQVAQFDRNIEISKLMNELLNDFEFQTGGDVQPQFMQIGNGIYMQFL